MIATVGRRHEEERAGRREYKAVWAARDSNELGMHGDKTTRDRETHREAEREKDRHYCKIMKEWNNLNEFRETVAVLKCRAVR